MATETMGLRSQAIRIVRGVGGRAYPKDFNWICPIDGSENRSWADFCQECAHRAR